MQVLGYVFVQQQVQSEYFERFGHDPKTSSAACVVPFGDVTFLRNSAGELALVIAICAAPKEAVLQGQCCCNFFI